MAPRVLPFHPVLGVADVALEVGPYPCSSCGQGFVLGESLCPRCGCKPVDVIHRGAGGLDEFSVGVGGGKRVVVGHPTRIRSSVNVVARKRGMGINSDEFPHLFPFGVVPWLLNSKRKVKVSIRDIIPALMKSSSGNFQDPKFVLISNAFLRWQAVSNRVNIMGRVPVGEGLVAADVYCKISEADIALGLKWLESNDRHSKVFRATRAIPEKMSSHARSFFRSLVVGQNTFRNNDKAERVRCLGSAYVFSAGTWWVTMTLEQTMMCFVFAMAMGTKPAGETDERRASRAEFIMTDAFQKFKMLADHCGCEGLFMKRYMAIVVKYVLGWDAKKRVSRPEGGAYSVLLNWLYAIEAQPSTQHLHAHMVLWSACMSDLPGRFLKQDSGTLCDMTDEVARETQVVYDEWDVYSEHGRGMGDDNSDCCEATDGLVGTESDSDDSFVSRDGNGNYQGLASLMASVPDHREDLDQAAFTACDAVDESDEPEIIRSRRRGQAPLKRSSLKLVDDEAGVSGSDEDDEGGPHDGDDVNHPGVFDDGESIEDGRFCVVCGLFAKETHKGECGGKEDLLDEFKSDSAARARILECNGVMKSKLEYGPECVSAELRQEHDRQRIEEHLSSGVSCQLEVDPELLKAFRTCECGGNLSVPEKSLKELQKRGQGEDPLVLVCDGDGCNKKYGSLAVLRRVLVQAYDSLGVPEDEVPFMDPVAKRASIPTRADGSVDHSVDSKVKEHAQMNRTFEIQSATSGFRLMFPTDREPLSVLSTTSTVNAGVWGEVDLSLHTLPLCVRDLIGGYVQEGMYEDRMVARLRSLDLGTTVLSCQLHDPLHRSTCFKNKNDRAELCRYCFPQAPVREGGVSIVFRDESGEIDHVLVSYTRGPAFLYFANTSMFLHKLAVMNTYSKMILSMDITYYVTKYTSKVQESAKILYEKVYNSIMVYRKRCETMADRSSTVDGYGRVYSAMNALTKCEVVSSTMAAYLNLQKGSRFVYALKDVRVPVSAFVDYLVSGVVQASLTDKYQMVVVMYLNRPDVFEDFSPIEFFMKVKVATRKTLGDVWHQFREHSQSGTLMCRLRKHPVTLTMFCSQLLDVSKLEDESSMGKLELDAKRETTAAFLLAMGTSYRCRNEFDLIRPLWDEYLATKLRTVNPIRPLAFFKNMLNESKSFVQDGSKNTIPESMESSREASTVEGGGESKDLTDPEVGMYDFGKSPCVRVVKDPVFGKGLSRGCSRTPLIQPGFVEEKCTAPLNTGDEEYHREIDRMYEEGPVRYADVSSNKGHGEDQFLPGLAANTKPEIFLDKVVQSLVVRTETLDVRYFEDPRRDSVQEVLKDVKLDIDFTCFRCFGHGHVTSECVAKLPASNLPMPNTTNGPSIGQHSLHWGLNEGQHGAFCLFALAVLDVALKRNIAYYDPEGEEDTVDAKGVNPVLAMIERLNKAGYANRHDLPGLKDLDWDRAYREYQYTDTVRCLGLGGPGRGKSFVVRAVLDYARAWGVLDSVVIASTSGSSALLVRGCTAQKSFDTNRDFKMMIVNRAACREFYAVKGIYILDEVGRFNGQIFQVFEECSRKARGCSLPFGGMHFFALGDLAQAILFHRGMFTTTTKSRAVDDPGLNMFRYIFNCGFELVADERCKSAVVTARNDRLACNMMTVEDLIEFNKLCSPYFPPRGKVAPCVVAVGNNLEAHRMCRRVQVDHMEKNPVADTAVPGAWRARGILMIEGEIKLSNKGPVDDELRDRIRELAPRTTGMVSTLFIVILGERNVVMFNQDVVKGVGKGASCVVVDVEFRVTETSCVYFRSSDGIGGGVHCVSAKDVKAVTMKSLDPYFSTRFYFGGPYEHASCIGKSDRVKGLLRGEFPLLMTTATRTLVKLPELKRTAFEIDVFGVPAVPGHALVGDFTQGMTLSALYLYSVRNTNNNDGLLYMLMSRVRNPGTDLRMRFKLSEDVNKYRPRVAFMKEMNRLRKFLFDPTGAFLCAEKLTARRYLSKPYELPRVVAVRVPPGDYACTLQDPYLEQVREHLKTFELRLNLGRVVEIKAGWIITFRPGRKHVGGALPVRVVVDAVVIVTHDLDEALSWCDLGELLPDCSKRDDRDRLAFARIVYLRLYRDELIKQYGLKLMKIRVEGSVPVGRASCSFPVVAALPEDQAVSPTSCVELERSSCSLPVLAALPVEQSVSPAASGELEQVDPVLLIPSRVGCWIDGDEVVGGGNHMDGVPSVVSRCQLCFSPQSNCVVGELGSICQHRLFTGGSRSRGTNVVPVGKVHASSTVGKVKLQPADFFGASRSSGSNKLQFNRNVIPATFSLGGGCLDARASSVNTVGDDARSGRLDVVRKRQGFEPYPLIDPGCDTWEISQPSETRCVGCGDPVGVDGGSLGKADVRKLLCPSCRLDGCCLRKPVGRQRNMKVTYMAPEASCLSIVSPGVGRDEMYNTVVQCIRDRCAGGGRTVLNWASIGVDESVSSVHGSSWITRFDRGGFFDTSIVRMYLLLVAKHFSSDRSKTFVAQFRLWEVLVRGNYNEAEVNRQLPEEMRVLLRRRGGKPASSREVCRLLVPVHIDQGPHFWLVVVDFARKVVLVFDSARQFQSAAGRVIGIKNLQGLLGTSFPTHEVECMPQTEEGNDCGPHTCRFAWVACIGLEALPVDGARATDVVCVNANVDGRCSIYAAGDVLTYSLESTVNRFTSFVESRASWLHRQIESVGLGTLQSDEGYQRFAQEQKTDHATASGRADILCDRWLRFARDEVTTLTGVHGDVLDLFSSRMWRDNVGASSGAASFGSFVSHVLASRGHTGIVVGQVDVMDSLPYETIATTNGKGLLGWVSMRGGTLSPRDQKALLENKLVLFITVNNGHWHTAVPAYLLVAGKIGAASHSSSGFYAVPTAISSSSSSSSLAPTAFGRLDSLMSACRLDGGVYRNRILADLVTGVLYYSSIAGSTGGRGCCCVGLVDVGMSGVNAVLQMLASCIHPCFYGGIRDGRSGLFEVLSRMVVPSTVGAPPISLVRAALSFWNDHKEQLSGRNVSVWTLCDYLIGLCGSRVKGLFALRLVTQCCSHEFSSPGGLYRQGKGSDWAHSEWCRVTCTCGGESTYVIKEPADYLLVRAEGGTVTAPLELDLRDLRVGLCRELLYDLKAMIVRTLTGRYVCCSHRSIPGASGGVWWQFDDEVVEPICAKEVYSRTGVVLMVYVLRESPSDDERVRMCMSLVDFHWRPVGAVGPDPSL